MFKLVTGGISQLDWVLFGKSLASLVCKTWPVSADLVCEIWPCQLGPGGCTDIPVQGSETGMQK